MINGINHVTFAVSNVEASVKFYVDVLGLELAVMWEKGAYMRAGQMWIALNWDKDAGTAPQTDYTHIAFNVPKEYFDEMRNRLEGAGVKPFKENVSEGSSYYFTDPDGHKLEIHSSTLDERLAWLRANGGTGYRFK